MQDAQRLYFMGDQVSGVRLKLEDLFRAQTVTRDRLFARLREGRGRRLSLVACPAGSRRTSRRSEPGSPTPVPLPSRR